jgi:acetyl-CoA synthetase
MTDARSPTQAFRNARDLLLRHRQDYPAALAGFTWPQLDAFNWALDWFDVIAAEHPGRDALRIVADGDAAARISYAEMAARSSQAANWLRGLGARRGDRLLLMLGNIAPLWEIILAAMKLGVVIIPPARCSARRTWPTGWPAATCVMSSPSTRTRRGSRRSGETGPGSR